MPGRRLTYLDRGPAPQRARTRLLCIDVSVSLFICLPLYVYSCNIQLQHADPYILQAHPAFGLKPLREYFQHFGSSFAPVLAYVDVDATELIRLVLWSNASHDACDIGVRNKSPSLRYCFCQILTNP